MFSYYLFAAILETAGVKGRLQMQKYTKTEATIALGVTHKTLNDWLRRADIVSNAPGTDGREKHLTYAQVKRLAHLHERTIAEDEIIHTRARSGTVRTLQSQLNDLQEEIRQIKELRALHVPPAREARPRVTESTPKAEPAHAEPPDDEMLPPRYVIQGGILSKGGIGRMAFRHGSANSVEYGRKFVAKHIPESERGSVHSILLWLHTNRPFVACKDDPTCACHSILHGPPNDEFRELDRELSLP